MKDKILELRRLMENYGIFQQDDEVGVALKELEDEVNSYSSHELYNEDFADGSLELELFYNNDRDINSINILYRDENR